VKNGSQDVKITAVVPDQADDRWHHLAATLNAKGLHFYLDGHPAGYATAATLPNGAEYFLGSDGTTHFAGATLDEARIYSRALDAKEIAAIYESERPKTPPDDHAKAPPAGHGKAPPADHPKAASTEHAKPSKPAK